MITNSLSQTRSESTVRSTSSETYIPSMNPLKKHVIEMKRMAKSLTPHTHPQASIQDEQDIMCLKQRTIHVDGYEATLRFSRADHEDYMLDVLQIQSYHAPFLPFHVVCKIGRAFMGQVALSYVEFFQNNRKVYCWAIKHKDA